MGYGITAEKLYDDAAKAKLSTDRTNPVYEWFTIVEQEAFSTYCCDLSPIMPPSSFTFVIISRQDTNQITCYRCPRERVVQDSPDPGPVC